MNPHLSGPEADRADEVARYLAQHPEFFDTHPHLLALLNIPHPQNGQAISLVERQSLLLRDRIRALESKIAEMTRFGAENDAIAERLLQWTRALLAQSAPAHLPATALDELRRIFAVPFAALRLFEVDPPFAHLDEAREVGADVIRLASSMQAPYCGANVGFEASTWMAAQAGSGTTIQSIAMIPLRVGASPDAFGLLVLGSPDKDRFHIAMGTTFLARIGELASAALARLRPAAVPAV